MTPNDLRELLANVKAEAERAAGVRRERMEALLMEYGSADLRAAIEAERRVRRYVGVQRMRDDGSWWLVQADTLPGVFERLSEEAPEGWSPMGVFDLDTGESIPLHVGRPVVSRSENRAAALESPFF